jgi:hypothetical protein
METLDREAKVARISDIIEQIEDLNKMIELHRNNDGDASTIAQYEFMRTQFVNELNTLLKDFKLDVRLAESAA